MYTVHFLSGFSCVMHINCIRILIILKSSMSLPSYIFKYIGTSYSCFTDIKLDEFTVVMANKAQFLSFFFIWSIKVSLASIWNCSSKYILLASVIKPRNLRSVTIENLHSKCFDTKSVTLCIIIGGPLTWHDLLEYFWKCKYKMETYCPGYQILVLTFVELLCYKKAFRDTMGQNLTWMDIFSLKQAYNNNVQAVLINYLLLILFFCCSVGLRGIFHYGIGFRVLNKKTLSLENH